MKIPWTLSIMLSACYLTASPPEISGAERWAMTAESSAYREADIQKRLAEMDCLFEPKYTNEVEAYLRAYLTYGRKDAEDLLGRSVLYFPVFEHYLQLHGLPEQLKYLPMIESRLHPVATSTTGAAGLWQFMPATARSLGLQINEYVDERRDPYKSTKAALQYLSRLYDRFGTWELTLAAYNCGSARVSRAIRYAGTTDFWEVRKYLPSETRKYVPRFIAANYLVNFYHVHGLSPNFPSFDIQWTRTTLVYTQLTFGQIAQKTGAPISLLYRLNPAYKKGVIPANPNGNFLVLPEPAMEKFKAWQSGKNPVAHTVSDGYEKRTYVVLAGDTIHKLARMFHCSVTDIMQWNNLRTSELFYRQELIIYRPKSGDLYRRA